MKFPDGRNPKIADKHAPHHQSKALSQQSNRHAGLQEMSKGIPTFLAIPDNDMNKANLHYNSAKSQQIAIKARIIKLQKEEEKAQKRINDTVRQQDFYERINSMKNEKYTTKYTFNREMKMKEEQNRVNFN